MSTHNAHTDNPKKEARTHVITLTTLLILTIITVGASYIDFGQGNIVIALAIATVKATIVALFFMHLLHDKPVNAVVAVAGFLFLWGIGPLGALVSGVMAKREIRLSNGTQGGGGLASAGIVLGALGLLLAIVAIVAMTGGLLVGHHLVFGDSR